LNSRINPVLDYSIPDCCINYRNAVVLNFTCSVHLKSEERLLFNL